MYSCPRSTATSAGTGTAGGTSIAKRGKLYVFKNEKRRRVFTHIYLYADGLVFFNKNRGILLVQEAQANPYLQQRKYFKEVGQNAGFFKFSGRETGYSRRKKYRGSGKS